MTQFVFENFVNTTLADAASSTATTLTLSSATGLPSALASGQQIPLVLNSASNGSVFEVCYITGINGSSVTVLRAQEGTSAQQWNVGDFAYIAMTAGTTAPVIATHSPTASETLPVANQLVVTPGTLTAGIDLTLNDAAAAGSGVTIYGSAADYAVTVQSPVTTGSPYIELPDGSQVYSWAIPAASPSQGIRVDWDGTNWRARTFGQEVVAPATQNNAAVQLGQVINGTPAIGSTASSTSATSVTATTATFTAPCNGWAIIFGYGQSDTSGTDGTGLSASLAGFLSLASSDATNYNIYNTGYLPMTTGQQSTFSMNATTGTAAALDAFVTVVFVPTP